MSAAVDATSVGEMAKKTVDEGSPQQFSQLRNKDYLAEMERLQAELVTLQRWVKETGARVAVIFEGRDAAGKGGTIKRVTENLSPRVARVAALPAPTERERGQWYFQRYLAHLPAAGEMVLFDRSWYNRAGVERVMGYCTEDEYRRFMRQCPIVEQMLIDDGIHLLKYWFSVSDDVQLTRFRKRLRDPLKQWKLSPTDLESIARWEEYSRAKDDMLIYTDTAAAPWHQVASDSKKHARINMISHLLDSLPYTDIDGNDPVTSLPDRLPSTGYQRPSLPTSSYVPDVASALTR